jgi:hypothetical protein
MQNQGLCEAGTTFAGAFGTVGVPQRRGATGRNPRFELENPADGGSKVGLHHGAEDQVMDDNISGRGDALNNHLGD